MATDSSGLREISSPGLFPWLRLFGGIGIALDGKKMMLGALGLALLWSGWAALDRIFPGSTQITPALASASPQRDLFFGFEPLARAASLVSDPIRGPAMPFLAMFELGTGTTWFVHAVLATLWAIAVWGVIGGAIARIAVVQLATGERVGLFEALKFAVRKFIPLVGAPLTPLAGVSFIAALCAVMGLLYRIPGSWGPTVAGVLNFLPLLAGLVMVLILAGAAAGWPLMVATVAAEGEDAFDALSRTYSYVYQRPGQYACYIVLAWIIGTLGLLVVNLFAQAVIQLAFWALAFGAPDALLNAYLHRAGGATKTPAAIHDWWLSLVEILALGWIYAYFWTTAATIYLLLRQDVDGTAWDDIHLPPQPVDSFAPGPEPSPPPAAASAEVPETLSSEPILP